MREYSTIVCGGTFDHFHLGHQDFLRFGMNQSEHIVVGLTTDLFAKEKQIDEIEPFVKRRNVLEDFLQKNGKTWQVVPIDDMFGPTLSPVFMADGILVSKSTRKGAEIINSKREEKGLSSLPLLTAPPTLAEDGMPISSSRIRNGAIDREGQLWIKSSWLTQTLVLPHHLRSRLSQPFGEVIKDFDSWIGSANLDKGKMITVGDVVTDSCNRLKISQKISVVDLMVGRNKKYDAINEHAFAGDEILVKIKNKPGTLSSELFLAVKDLFANHEKSKRFILQIDGEEDLVVLPLVLGAALGFSILYGQPREGVVLLRVDEASKREMRDIVDQFSLKNDTY